MTRCLPFSLYAFHSCLGLLCLYSVWIIRFETVFNHIHYTVHITLIYLVSMRLVSISAAEKSWMAIFCFLFVYHHFLGHNFRICLFLFLSLQLWFQRAYREAGCILATVIKVRSYCRRFTQSKSSPFWFDPYWRVTPAPGSSYSSFTRFYCIERVATSGEIHYLSI